MTDPKKDLKPAPPAATPPMSAPSSMGELEKAKAELAELEAKEELARVKARIDSLRHDGKTPAVLAHIREMEAKRAKTHTFEVDGKRFAKYQTKEVRYLNNALVKAGSIVDYPWETLPGDSLIPVAKKRPTDEQSFEAQDEG